MNTTDLTPLPPQPDVDQYIAQADTRVRDRAAPDRKEAQLAIAREHGFADWQRFTSHIHEYARRGSDVAHFESAADAIVDGDADTLQALLDIDPELIRRRSTRVHEARLLHYVGANGFENWRQRSPKNAVEIAQILLRAGAEVDATAPMYGVATTLGLVATSVHPLRAGVQIPLIHLLLDHGAAIEGAPGGWPPLMSALQNQCPAAAETLAARGARIDNVVAAAALGRLDLVQRFAGDPELPRAFIFACMYGRVEVAEHLLRNGIDPAVTDREGQTALHWAAAAGQMDVIELLLRRGAPLEAKNQYGGTVLDQTLWFAFRVRESEMESSFAHVDYPKVVGRLLAAGARTDVYPEMQKHVDEVLRR